MAVWPVRVDVGSHDVRGLEGAVVLDEPYHPGLYLICYPSPGRALVDVGAQFSNGGGKICSILFDDQRYPVARCMCVNGERVALVTTMWANNEVGTIQPVAELAALANEYSIPLHTDAIQAIGQVPVDFAASGASALSATGHKLGGPVGVGALLLSRDTPCTALLHGGGQERDVRSGTLDVAGIVAFSTAVEIAVKRQHEYATHVGAVRDALVARVQHAVPDAVLNGDPHDRLPGNAHFSFPGCEGDALLLLLDAQGIACSTGSACSAGVAQPSHVLLAMGAGEAMAGSALRFTLGHTSTMDDVDYLAAALPGTVERARRASGIRAHG